MLLAVNKQELIQPRTEILFRTPKGTDFYLQGFSAHYHRTVAAGAQTSPELGFQLRAANWPILEPGKNSDDIPVSISMVTTPAGGAYIRGMLPQLHKCPPLSIIYFTVLGWAAGVPATISITLQGRTGFLKVGG
jgi:hypothetical protein